MYKEIMRNDLNINLDRKESVESLSWKEKIWTLVFWEEYKPDFSYEKFFINIKSKCYDSGIWILKRKFDDDKERFLELFYLLKNNWFKINIQFLESLNDKQKNYLSLLFLDIYHNRLDEKRLMGKSLFIWFCRYELELYRENYIDKDKLYKISKNFKDFNLFYFRQAYDCLTMEWDRNIYHIISEYNLIKNLDQDIKLLEVTSKLDLWKNFSLWIFHSCWESSWYWREKIWWYKELDKNGNDTEFKNVWRKYVLDECGDKDHLVLDRNHFSSYKDASWVFYGVFLDSPTWIALFYKNRPVACISFFIKNWNEFFINQIQKVPYCEYDEYGRLIWRHYSSNINGIDWEKILYNVVKNLAKKFNIDSIIIQWWKNNKRTKKIYEDYETYYFKEKTICLEREGLLPPKNKWKVHLDLEIARRIYDVFAESLWFSQNSGWDWEKEI